jgi:hypothetical protein
MEDTTADLFQVFLREYRHCTVPPEVVERPLAACATYEEARRVRAENQRDSREVVIRYLGQSGGGD